MKLLFNIFKSWFPFKTKIHLYTDGSQKGKWGSWAFVVVKNDTVIFEKAGRVARTDSLHMEFQAAIEGLQTLPASSDVTLFTDSKILIDTMTGKNKHTPRNIEQVHFLRDLQKRHRVIWTWVKAHHGVIHNERCDELCILAREDKL